MKGIAFIGMPGAGKSVVGKKLSIQIGWKFIDLDDYILETQKTHHHDFMMANGEQALMDLENELTLSLDLADTIFSPPGSIVYSRQAMDKIKKDTFVVYIKVSLEEVKKHLGDKINRNGIIGLREKGIEGLFKERTPLYEAYADLILDTQGLDLEVKIKKTFEELKAMNVFS